MIVAIFQYFDINYFDLEFASYYPVRLGFPLCSDLHSGFARYSAVSPVFPDLAVVPAHLPPFLLAVDPEFNFPLLDSVSGFVLDLAADFLLLSVVLELVPDHSHLDSLPGSLLTEPAPVGLPVKILLPDAWVFIPLLLAALLLFAPLMIVLLSEKIGYSLLLDCSLLKLLGFPVLSGLKSLQQFGE